VQEDYPRIYAHAAFVSGRTKVAERINRLRELGDARLELQTLVARLFRLEKDGTTLQVTDLVDGIVWKDVPGAMVGDRHRQPIYPRPLLDVVENCVEALIVKVGGEREHRCLHGARLYIWSDAIKPREDLWSPPTPCCP
jgi:hypothetical protein